VTCFRSKNGIACVALNKSATGFRFGLQLTPSNPQKRSPSPAARRTWHIVFQILHYGFYLKKISMAVSFAIEKAVFICSNAFG
jgi:hypothetical protein